MPTATDKTLLNHLTQRLALLVSAPTLTGTPEVSQRVIANLAEQFRSGGMSCVADQHEGFPYLYAHFQPLADTKLWLYAHLDVVEADATQFKLQAKRGRLYARGAFDMKFAIAVYQQLCAELADAKPPIGIIITSDEEHSGQYGSGYLAPKLQLAGKSVVIPDGGGVWSIERAAKGAIWAHIDVTGNAAHAARIDQGTNAIMRVLAVAQEVKAALAANRGNGFNDTTINLGRMSGGQAINQVPSAAHADLDIRFAPPLTLDAIRDRLAAVAANTGATITTSGAAVASRHDTANPDTQRLRAIMATRTGQPVPFVDSYGSSDAQYFSTAGANPIVFYPEGGGHHTTEEYITERGLLQCYEILREFVAEL